MLISLTLHIIGFFRLRFIHITFCTTCFVMISALFIISQINLVKQRRNLICCWQIIRLSLNRIGGAVTLAFFWVLIFFVLDLDLLTCQRYCLVTPLLLGDYSSLTNAIVLKDLTSFWLFSSLCLRLLISSSSSMLFGVTLMQDALSKEEAFFNLSNCILLANR